MVARLKLMNYAKWIIRITILSCVIYLAFFKQVKTITEFNTNTPIQDSLIVVDYKIMIHEYNDSVIKQNINEKIITIDTIHIDSLRSHLLRSIR